MSDLGRNGKEGEPEIVIDRGGHADGPDGSTDGAERAGRGGNWFRHLMEFAGRDARWTILGCVLSATSGVLGVLPYVCIFLVVRDVLAVWPDVGQAMRLPVYGWWAMGLSVASVLLYFGGLMLTHVAAFATTKNIRLRAMTHLLRLPVGYFGRQQSGRIRKTIDENAELTHGLMAHHLPDVVSAVTTPVAILAVLVVYDWRLGLLCLLPVVVGFLCEIPMFGPGSARDMAAYIDALEDMNGQAVEYVRGIPVVKVFQQTVYSFTNFHRSIIRYRDFSMGYARRHRIPMVAYTVAINGAFLVLVPAGVLWITSAADPRAFLGDYIFYLIFCPVATTMMSRLMYAAQGLAKAGEAVTRINSILAEEPLPQPDSPQVPTDASIRFDRVTFAYPGARTPAVVDVSFDVPAGMTVALVGPSGGGKTTVAELVPRFRDVEAGRVLVGGVDVRDISSEALMDQVAFVFQDTRLFHDTVGENIRAGRPGATQEQVRAAARAAQCEDILEKLPDGLDTIIGGSGGAGGGTGIHLSGGEQQRLAVARAILKDAPIIVLDEATAFADADNEAAIQQALGTLTRDRTVLLIAHRLSTVRNADQILVMAHGSVVECGTHDELVAAEGRYATMWRDYQESMSWKIGKAAAS